MDNTIKFVATSMFGLEKYVGNEIEALGCKKLETIDGRVTFSGEVKDIARANMFIRTAERVYIHMGSFEAYSFTQLFDGVKSLPWEQWIGQDDAFPVTGHSIKSDLYSIPDCQKIIKKAVVERLHDEYGISWFSEEGAKVRIEFFILNNQATLMIDTSGFPLHKRGYRPEAGIAPLRETLASAMAYVSRPREEVLFWDPFCGSGTIAIEAAMIMTNTPPGLGRHFAAEEFCDIPERIWRDAREEGKCMVKSTSFEAYASDIDPKAVDIARANISRAGMGKHIKCFVRDARQIVRGERRGTIVCNPPYGERMMEKDEVNKLIREVGQAFERLSPWQVYILSSAEDFERIYGKKADKIKKMYNGMIKCGLYQYFKAPLSSPRQK